MNNAKGTIAHLIVDSAAFIKNAKLEEIGNQIYTVPEVLSEIKDLATRERLQALPYELVLKSPEDKDILAIENFAKKTGDIASLSLTDIRVAALTLRLERETAGTTEHLRTEPHPPSTVHVASRRLPEHPGTIIGFHLPKGGAGADPPQKQQTTDKTEDASCSFSEDESSENEDTDWITEDNLEEALVKSGGGLASLEPVDVACITTDFSIQNVLLQMGLHAVSLDGLLVTRLRTFLLYCHGCFKTTDVMTKKFCPTCGNPTLNKVSMSVDPETGQRVLHLSRRKKLTTRGLRHSLPLPRGGKHGRDPVLCEDQRVAHNRIPKKATEELNVLDPDYVARDSPFLFHDVTSRSAVLGIRSIGRSRGTNPNHWTRGKKRGGKKH